MGQFSVEILRPPGSLLGGNQHTYTSPPVGSITTKNSPLWKSDPRQQIAYFSVRSWGRLYAPEVILGIYDRDEAEQIGPDRAKDITPIIDPFSDDPPVEQEGSRDALAVDGQDNTADAETLTGEADSGQTEYNSQSSATSPDEGSADATTSSVGDPAADLPPDDQSGTEEGDNPGQVTTEQAAPSSTYSRADCVKAFMRTATDPDLDITGRRGLLAEMKDWWKDALSADLDFVKACLSTADKVAKGELQEAAARTYLDAIPAPKAGA